MVSKRLLLDRIDDVIGYRVVALWRARMGARVTSDFIRE